jgi:hypothetical protein
MTFINTGVYINGKRPKTKKELREAIKNDPSSVTFDVTSMFDSTSSYKADDAELIRSGVALSIVGPDPYNDRKWYATYKKGKLS